MTSQGREVKRRSGRRSRVVDYDDVTRAALRLFVETGSLDVATLAERLAVGRATLYRVIDGQDRLLGDVLWTLTNRTIRLAAEGSAGYGVDRLVGISRAFHDMVRAFEPLRQFTEREPERAFVVLFTPLGGVHQRTVELWATLFRTAEAAGEVRLPFDADQFAEMFVRLGETMLWADLLGAGPVDVQRWEDVRRSLFDPAIASAPGGYDAAVSSAG